LTTNLLDRVPVDRIQAEAHQVDLARLLLTALVGILYAVGWLAGKAVIVLVAVMGWLAVGARFTVASIRLGWQDARQPSGGRTVGTP
jgi:hypothetical protein